tara:strand:+ start:33158 stop:33631 length:474 start_codon:yes stop_codon:yes gene_type:complete
MVRAIRDDNGGLPADQHISFTPENATAMLPLVRRIVDELTRLSQSIEAQRRQVRGVADLNETSSQPDYQDELNDIHSTIAEEEERLQSCLQELSALGIEPHMPINGYVDFPTSLNRRGVQLCWHPGEKEVSHWHEIGEAAEDRKRIDHHKFGNETLN